tara:strand:- start:854 stop:1114 length:261 start_codon:yes stop_codon:yes gene_type:complete
MNYRSILKTLLLEKGGKKAKGLETYYFLAPTNLIKHEPSGYKYTISKVSLEPEVEIHCYRSDLDPDEPDVMIVVTADDFEKFYKVA